MRVSYKWLQDYVDLDIPPDELAHRLTMVGLEVEELKDRYAYLDSVRVGRVASVADHPKSDHLKICRVETGRDVYQVVCGAPNVSEGMLAPLALVGTEMPGGRPVAEAEIRGVRSVGMLCSEAELMLGPDHSGIWSLPATARMGQGLKEATGVSDWVFEIGITPNRADCLSFIGVAREIAGMLGRPLKYPVVEIRESGQAATDQASVRIEAPDHCPRYVARVINGVNIGPSPFWLVDRLSSIGLRSISNVVDITNFVMMEMGQPLHAFDLNHVDQHRIVVKTAQEGDRFVTLDAAERILGPAMLMICDAGGPVGVAGVMGGLNSEIVPETTDVLLESAYFDPISIRRTAKNLGLPTEASFRFERGIDQDGCLNAANRAAALMADLAGGRVAPGVMDEHPKPRKTISIPFSSDACNAFLGTEFEPADMKTALTGIELPVSGEGDQWTVDVPGFRVDLYREVDLFEEVARLIGYDRIPVTQPSVRDKVAPVDPSRAMRADIRNNLQGLGLTEVINYSFIAEDFCDRLKLPVGDDRRRTIRIINPLSEDQVLMRTTLVPGLLDVCRRNQSYKVNDVAIFESGQTFFRTDGQELPDERLFLGGLLVGSRKEQSWHGPAIPLDFYDLKGVIEDLLLGLRISEATYSVENTPAYYDQRVSARISVDGRTLGWLGRITGPVAAAFGLREAPFVFELDLAALLDVQKGIPRFAPLPRYPSVERDIALVLDRNVAAGEVIGFMNGLGQEFLTRITLFDVYEGPQVGDGRRSLAFRLLFRSPERTLTDEEVNIIHQQVTDKVLQAFSATLRA